MHWFVSHLSSKDLKLCNYPGGPFLVVHHSLSVTGEKGLDLIVSFPVLGYASLEQLDALTHQLGFESRCVSRPTDYRGFLFSK